MLNVAPGRTECDLQLGASGIIFFDLDGKIIEANPRGAADARLRRGPPTVHRPRSRPRIRAGWRRGSYANIRLLTCRHGRHKPLSPSAGLNTGIDDLRASAQVISAVHDEQGEIRYFISMMQDVTEHKLLEDVAVIANEAKASLEEALERIVEELAIQLGFQAAHVLLVHEQSARIVPTGIWYLAEPGMLPNFSELTKATTFAPGAGHVGRVLSSSVATLDRDLPHSADSLRIAAAIDDGLRTGLFVPMIIHNDVVGVIEFYSTEDRDVDPTLLETLTRIAPQLGWLIERERAKEALELKSAELERSNRDLERFASVASHDLQEPLRAIGRCTALLRDQYGDQFEEDAAQLFFFIADGVERMEALITDLLRYSRISTATVEHTLVDLDQVVRDVLQDLTVAIDENDAVITVSDLPVVRGNDTQLHQIFQNLIGNALKYRGQDPPRIRISVRASGSDWLFSIKDNGIGIDPVYHAQIFDIFRRLHARDQYTGTGIGLAIVKRIVEQHQGRLWVESTEGEGSTFFFTLPIPGGNGSHRDDRTAQ
ncbi:MAG: ATP-binding protein [Thermomicrobiales bacterium]